MSMNDLYYNILFEKENYIKIECETELIDCKSSFQNFEHKTDALS